MARDAPSFPLRTNATPAPAATTTASKPAEVNQTMSRCPARMDRTSALTDAPISSSATMACTATAPWLNTVDQNDLPVGSVTYRFTALPSPNWITSSTAAPMQFPRSPRNPAVRPAARVACAARELHGGGGAAGDPVRAGQRGE